MTQKDQDQKVYSQGFSALTSRNRLDVVNNNRFDPSGDFKDDPF